MKPVCVPCRRFFSPDRIGIEFVEGYPQTDHAPKGNAALEHWAPYKLWAGDRWRCEGCSAVIIVGVALKPIAEHYQPQFAKRAATAIAELQVNDC